MNSAYSRLKFIFLIALVALGLVWLRLGEWQVLHHQELSKVAQEQYASGVAITARRGRILDNNGSVLVGNEEVARLIVPPGWSGNSSDLAQKLSQALVDHQWLPPAVATDEAQRAAWLSLRETRYEATLSAQRYGVLLSGIERDKWASFAGFLDAGLRLEPTLRRAYPEASLAAQLVGFVGKNEWGEDQGYYGIEGAYDRELSGRSGWFASGSAPGGWGLLGHLERFLPYQHGSDIRLTLDKRTQQIAEQHLQRAITRYGAAAGEVVILDPKTGGILAMASWPGYDPGNFHQYQASYYRTPSISDLYEPGSTLKIITVAAALAEEKVTASTTCPMCSGPLNIGGYPIRTWNEEYNADISVKDALAKSDNTAMVWLQQLVGKDNFLKWLDKFALFAPTGVDLQGEAKPLQSVDSTWRERDLAIASFGQGIAINSLQLVRAAAVFANGGYLVKPHVVAAVWQKDKWQDTQTSSEQIISTDLAEEMKEIMVYSANQGDAQWLKDGEIRVAGKTGTAQIAEGGTYRETGTIASFIGFAPADNPQFVMLTKLIEPTLSPWGSETAAPLWYDIARSLLTGYAPPSNP